METVTDVHDPVTATVVVVVAAAVVSILIEEIKGQHRKNSFPPHQ